MPSQKDKTENTGTNGHSTASQEMYENWRGYYQKMTDDGMSYYRQGMDMFQKMAPFYPANSFMQGWMENYQTFLDRVRDESGAGSATDMDSYRRMYDAWLETWTKSLEGYMRTPEFVAKSGKDLEAFTDFQNKMGDMMDTYWNTLHLPNTADMKELYQKLYTIDRKLDELDRRFREFAASSKSSATAKK
jgi:hypothetical protein